MSKKILLLGSGYVADPVVEYLLRRPENRLTIASAHAENAQTLKDKFPSDKTVAVGFNVEDPASLDPLVESHDLVISLIPWTFHVLVIKSAIKFRKNVVTTSYVNPFMKELDQAAKDAGILVLNEVGVDPGIDHFYALKMINHVHKEGGKINSFLSWCGGLPAPEASNNPLGYKFSWSPRGVLLALRSTAKFLENGKVVTVEGKDLLKSAKPVFVYPAFALEGYPNRDSTSYGGHYGIPEAHTILRGTLRYQGNPKFMQALVDCGFLDDTPRPFLTSGSAHITWREAFAKLLNCEPEASKIEAAVVAKTGISGEDKDRIIRGMKWVGLFSESEPIKAGNFLDCLAKTLEVKMQYQPGERDMIILQHKFDVELKNGKKQYITSTLIEYGQPNGVTAMAKTVGIPCAITVQLILDGKIHNKGIMGPMLPDIYEPIITELEKEGIRVIDEIIDL